MIGATINLTTETDARPFARSLALGDGRTSMSVDMSATVTAILPGCDGEAVAYARRLADALLIAANALDDALNAKACDEQITGVTA